MARTNNLSNFLTDIANAIRAKKGTQTQILAANFDTEIASIQSGVMTQEEYDNALTLSEQILDEEE